MKRPDWGRLGVAVALLLGLGLAVAIATNATKVAVAEVGGALPTPAAFVGSEACAGCHAPETNAWRGSQHNHAMAHADAETVLGDFSGATFEHFGVTSRFFRDGEKFMVETDGPDGVPGVFEVKYTFGLDPLQQYLVEFPDGRLQALSLAWDARALEAGGQRWFHLYPDEPIAHDDILHWTKLNQNWNFMCAECHSTGVRKNYDADSDSFATKWSEISVGCEACHGEGSGHVDWARAQRGWWPFGRTEDPDMGLLARFDERRDVTWSADPETGHPQRSVPPAGLRTEVEACGRCHARRSEISEAWTPGRPLSDTHAIAALEPGLYHADGQMLDEVYNYGSFKQSRMFDAGVTCSDCHDPHSGELRAAGDGVCLQCHEASKVADASHSRHAQVDPPLGCVDCHMPVRTYMQVDPRHDHGFRIPRPDLSVALGTPNACNDCHADRSPEWAAEAIAGWHGPEREGFQTYAAAFHAAWTEDASAPDLLAAVVSDLATPGFARAAAYRELSAFATPVLLHLARTGLGDPDPMVRIGALEMLEGVPLSEAWPLAAPLLDDSVLAVRMQAVSLLAGVPSAELPSGDRARFDRAAADYVAAQRLNADRPEARAALGGFYQRRGQAAEAEEELEAALRLAPSYAPAAANLADLYRALGREADAEAALRAGLAASPGDAGLHHALGLALVRQRRLDAALEELQRAAETAPDNARYAYVFGVALSSAGRTPEAIAALEAGLTRHPRDRDTLSALVGLSRDAGDAAAALGYAEQLSAASPGDEEVRRLVEGLRAQAAP